MIPITESGEKKGYLFEALWLTHRMRERRGQFQFLINGMVVTDPTKPKRERDIHEFDVIELLIDESGEDYLYPVEYFALLDLPQGIDRVIRDSFLNTVQPQLQTA